MIQNEVLRITSEQTARFEHLRQGLLRRRPGDADSELRAELQHWPAGRIARKPERPGLRRAGRGRWAAVPLTLAKNEEQQRPRKRPAARCWPRWARPTWLPRRRTCGTQARSAGPGGLGGGVQADFDTLIELITTTIAPQSWDEVGGPGSISGFDTNLSLVVSQTQEVHEQIADLLEQLRRLQDLQVTIEVRFITLSDNFFERIGVDFDFNIDDNTRPDQRRPVAEPASGVTSRRQLVVRRRQQAIGIGWTADGPTTRPGLAVHAGQLRLDDAAVRQLRRRTRRPTSALRSSATLKCSS